MNYYNKIKDKLIDDEVYARIKDYSREKHKILTYYEVGRLLSEAGKHYGYDVVGEYSKKLAIDVGKKFDKSTLLKMKRFYLRFANGKLATVPPVLTWSHYIELIPIKDNNKLNYYLNICINGNIGIRELREKIKSKEYERLDDNTKLKLITNEKLEIKDIIPNPILIPNKNNINIESEKVLEQVILENIADFLKQLGSSFSFIDNEYKIKLDNRYNYIDLLLFNIEYNCYVVIELKTTELKKEHIGQIQIYMNYIDKNVKKLYHGNTIGIIICKKNNHYVIEYASDNRIISRSYELVST